MESLNISEILEAYLICALWSSIDDTDQPMDDNYGTDDVAAVAAKEQQSEIEDWLGYCDDLGLIESLLEHPNYNEPSKHSMEEKIGHDFWLTRNGHGAGFWDRGLGQLGQELSDACKTFGSCDPYVGDDGLVYFS